MKLKDETSHERCYKNRKRCNEIVTDVNTLNIFIKCYNLQRQTTPIKVWGKEIQESIHSGKKRPADIFHKRPRDAY